MNESAPQGEPGCTAPDGCKTPRACQFHGECLRSFYPAAPQAAPSVAAPSWYAFKHNRGNGKVGWTFHSPEEYPTAYRDTCLEIVPLFTMQWTDALINKMHALADGLDAGLTLPAVVQVEPTDEQVNAAVKIYLESDNGTGMTGTRAAMKSALIAALRHQAAPNSTQPAAPQLDTQRATEGMPAPVWQDIETAPKNGKRVLLGASGWACEGYFDDERHEWYQANEHWTDAHSEAIYPTRWMPLPPPPQENKQ